MKELKDIIKNLSHFTKGPGNSQTDSKVIEAGIAGLFLLAGYGLMKFLSNSKAKINKVEINAIKASTEKKNKDKL